MDGKTNINGMDIRFRTTGEGADVVLLHGWGCDHTIWEGVQKHLEDRFRVTSIDLPGFGESSEPPVAWGVEEYASSLELFLEKQGIENPILMSHSHGGRVSILYGSRNPVRKIILVDAAGVKPRRSLRYYLKVYSFKTMKRLAPLFLGKKRAAEMIEKKRSASGSADYNAASPVMRATLSRVVNTDLRRVMPLITAPTLLVWGEKDTATPLDNAKKMEKLIPGSGLVVFPDAGHYSFLERPAQFAAVIDSFLEPESKVENRQNPVLHHNS